VTLNPGARLVLRPDNQPAYRLVPLQGRRFRIAELEGHSVEFRGDATLDELIFHQPDGTLWPRASRDRVRRSIGRGTADLSDAAALTDSAAQVRDQLAAPHSLARAFGVRNGPRKSGFNPTCASFTTDLR
jgi:hypothetical protein